MPPILPPRTCYSVDGGRGELAFGYDDDALLQVRMQRCGMNPHSMFDVLIAINDGGAISVVARRLGSCGPPTTIGEPSPQLFPSDTLLARLSCI